MNFFQKYKIHFIRATAVIFLLGIFAGLGGYFLAPGNGPAEAVATVDGDKIPLHLFYSHYMRALNQVQPGTNLDDAARRQKRDEALRDLVTLMAYKKEAQKYGIRVPDAQVRNSMAQIPAFQENGQFSISRYAQALQSQLRVTPQEFEEEQRTSIAFFKLRWLIQSSLRVTDKELDLQYDFAKKSGMKDLPKDRASFAEKLMQDKTMWVFNQWLTQVGSKLRVKTYLDRIEGIR